MMNGEEKGGGQMRDRVVVRGRLLLKKKKGDGNEK